MGKGGSHVGVPQWSKAPGGIDVIPFAFKSIAPRVALEQLPMRPSGAPAPAPATLNRCRGNNSTQHTRGISAWTHLLCRRTRGNTQKGS
jgi:hypothetical protein